MLDRRAADLSHLTVNMGHMAQTDVRAALDIETSGLNPSTDRILAVAIDTGPSVSSRVSDNERDLLRWINQVIESLPEDAKIVTWNGEEFDLPFLKKRFAVHGIPTSLQLEPRHETGKYGNPLFKAVWGRRRHWDIAPTFRHIAEERSVKWSLKPVARALLHTEPLEVDRRGSSISAMSTEALQAYVESDARTTQTLCRWLADHKEEVPTATI